MEAAGSILKFLRERSVCAPQYLPAGTFTLPMVYFYATNYLRGCWMGYFYKNRFQASVALKTKLLLMILFLHCFAFLCFNHYIFY